MKMILEMFSNVFMRVPVHSSTRHHEQGPDGEGGGAVFKQIFMGRLHHEVQPLTLLYTIFDEKGTLFVYLLLTNATPFTYLV